MGCRGSGSESDPFTYLPVNIDRLIWNAQRQFRIKMQEPTSLDPKVCIYLFIYLFICLFYYVRLYYDIIMCDIFYCILS